MLYQSLFIFSTLVSHTFAFTNGTLLPSYLCGPSKPDLATGKLVGKDGLPKSLGAVLATFEIPGAALAVASYHNQNSITAQTNLIKVTLNAATITGGQEYTLTLTTTSGSNLEGILLFAMDSAGNKVGSFTGLADGNVSPFPACGPNNVGIVHNQVLSETATYAGIVWKAPSEIETGNTIIFSGLTDTDLGFGFHMNQFPFTAAARRCHRRC